MKGGEAIENKEIAQDVVVNGTLGFLLQGSNIVYPEIRSSSWCRRSHQQLKCLISIFILFIIFSAFKVKRSLIIKNGKIFNMTMI